MNKKEWKKQIEENMQENGTYRESFFSAIDTLADILEQRDKAYEKFVEDGSQATIIRISDRGAENIAKNPQLTVWMDLNTQALAYWRDLGLTPSGLKKLDDTALKKKKVDVLAEALKGL